MTTARPGYALCKGCGEEILLVRDDSGQAIALSLRPPTYAIVGEWKDHTPRVSPSRSYVSHEAVCIVAEMERQVSQKPSAE